MYLRRLYRLFEAHLGHYRRYALREHAFTGAGRAYEQNIVPAGDGDLYRLFRRLLPFDVGKVEQIVGKRP